METCPVGRFFYFSGGCKVYCMCKSNSNISVRSLSVKLRVPPKALLVCRSKQALEVLQRLKTAAT